MQFDSAAVSGFVGGLAGAAATLVSVFLKDWLAHRHQRKFDKDRKAMLKQMLTRRPSGTEWRSMDTLSRVIGASREETARLLIAIGARGSEKHNDVWALMSEKPLPLRQAD